MNPTPALDSAVVAHWRTWIGRTERREDIATAAPLAALAATLDRDEPEPQAGAALPPLGHWLYFLPRARQSELGPDGHAARGEFLPPVPLPRRMWAGGRLEFERALRVGAALTRTSRIERVDAKHGRSGALVFVTVRHTVADADGVALTEEHDIVYRDAPRADRAAPDATPATAAPAPAAPALPPAQFSRSIVPDPVLLFRYSALTFNGHRIHYDRRYVTEVEGYPGLVVHGPLIATLLVDLLRRQRPAARLRRLDYTALRPVFDLQPLTLCGAATGAAALALWALDGDGQVAMRAQVQLAAD